MAQLLTPKQVANAIGVSESSVKRWCDKGVIRTQYTAGGHRRIPVDGLLRFFRETKQPIARPELIGLPSNTGRSDWVLERAADALASCLLAGEEDECRRIVFDLYLAEHDLSAICDKVVSPTLHKVGDLWECGEAEVFQERRGCETLLRILRELLTLPTPPADGPVAIGGAPEGDEYQLPSTMAELILREAGWQAKSLGHNLPFPTLAAAIRMHRPRLLWLSCSHMAEVEDFVNGYQELFDEFGRDIAFVIGGQAMTESVRQRIKFASFGDTMSHLETFAQTLAKSS